jgi:hypothetical protein
VFGYRPTDKFETNYDIMRSEDRGKTFSVVLPNVFLPTGFTGVTGSSALYLGMSVAGGLYRSVDDGRSFEKLLADEILRVTCLAEHAGKLWVCANRVPNFEAIWTLKDDASGLDKVMSFDAVVAPVACTDAAANELCAVPWHDFDIEVHPKDDDAGVSPELDAGVDAAIEDQDAEAEEAEPELDADEPEEEELDAGSKARRSSSRCQFGVSRSGSREQAGLMLLGLLALAYRRARRA